MLLWLCLLLWTGSCWAGEMYGKGTWLGSDFYMPEDNLNDINAIEFYYSAIGILKGFRVRIESYWSEVYCHEGPIRQLLTLEEGEYVVSIEGDFKIYILSLVVTTSWGRRIPFGSREGHKFKSGNPLTGKVLTSLYGHCGPLGISKIGFGWNFPLVQEYDSMTPPSESTSAPSTTS